MYDRHACSRWGQLGYAMERIRIAYKNLTLRSIRNQRMPDHYTSLDRVTNVENKRGLKARDQVQFTQPVPQKCY